MNFLAHHYPYFPLEIHPWRNICKIPPFLWSELISFMHTDLTLIHEWNQLYVVKICLGFFIILGIGNSARIKSPLLLVSHIVDITDLCLCSNPRKSPNSSNDNFISNNSLIECYSSIYSSSIVITFLNFWILYKNRTCVRITVVTNPIQLLTQEVSLSSL